MIANSKKMKMEKSHPPSTTFAFPLPSPTQISGNFISPFKKRDWEEVGNFAYSFKNLRHNI